MPKLSARLSYARSRAIVYLRRLLVVLYRLKFQHTKEVDAVLSHYAGTESSAVNSSDAMALSDAVHNRKPMCVLELGPGTSTAIIAAALSPNAKFIAIESDDAWLQTHREEFPSSLASKVTMLHSPVKSDNAGTTVCYSDIPDHPYDFVHIDGPPLAKYGTDIGSDIVRILGKLAPSCIIIFDGRQESALFARPYLERTGFKMRRNPFSLNMEFTRD